MNIFNLDITRIVKYVCLTSIAIVGIIFGCHTFECMFVIYASIEHDKTW